MENQATSAVTSSYFARRSSAAFIDYLICFALTSIYVYAFGSDSLEGFQVQGCGHAFALFAIWAFVLPLPEAFTGRTLGKWGFDLRVVGTNRSRMTIGQSFLRRVFDLVDFFSFFGLVGFVVAKTNASHQRVGDLVAKTFVIDEKATAVGPLPNST